VSRLGPATLTRLPPAVARPLYGREAVKTGIVHFGPGAFHRAHQADYIDRLLETDPRWGIAAVSLRSAGTVRALAEQDGLYTLATLDAETGYRILGAHTRFLGPGEAEIAVLLADPAVRIVTSTVTEKGYCLAGDGTLDFSHPDIVHDLADARRPRSLVGWLALGLAARRAAGTAPFTPLCCDNMVSNGTKLGAAVTALAARLDPELARWIQGEVRFPDTMVDSITPAADAALLARVRAATGFDDAVPVAREAYKAWVIEDVLPPGGPDFAATGAVLTNDVGAHELAKLRILNGAHSSLSYLGLLRGHETVADAMADPALAGFVEQMVREDVIPSLNPAALDLQLYAGEIFARFRNPAIGHRLSQIAWDGSQKLPYRLLDTIADARAAGRPVARLAIPVAAWMRVIERQAQAGREIVDPLAGQLAGIARAAESLEDLLDGMLGLRQIFPPALTADAPFRAALLAALRRDPAALVREEQHA
jgi:fructuronate reductase